jgi:hypothetical protein
MFHRFPVIFPWQNLNFQTRSATTRAFPNLLGLPQQHTVAQAATAQVYRFFMSMCRTTTTTRRRTETTAILARTANSIRRKTTSIIKNKKKKNNNNNTTNKWYDTGSSLMFTSPNTVLLVLRKNPCLYIHHQSYTSWFINPRNIMVVSPINPRIHKVIFSYLATKSTSASVYG